MADSSAAVDLDAPLVEQVGRLGDGYIGWVHRPIRPGRSLRLFRSSWLEALSHTPWWVVPIVWLPVALVAWSLALRGGGLPGVRVLALSGFGVFSWTLLEYGLHRWVFHHEPHSALGRRLHFLAHGIHHLDPWDPTRLVMPPAAAALLAVPVVLTLYVAALLLAPGLAFETTAAVFAGVLVGYVVYDLTHYASHHRRPRTAWGKRLKAWHLAHHHKWPSRLFGVTQPFWDRLLGTGRPRDVGRGADQSSRRSGMSSGSTLGP